MMVLPVPRTYRTCVASEEESREVVPSQVVQEVRFVEYSRMPSQVFSPAALDSVNALGLEKVRKLVAICSASRIWTITSSLDHLRPLISTRSSPEVFVTYTSGVSGTVLSMLLICTEPVYSLPATSAIFTLYLPRSSAMKDAAWEVG